MRMKESPNTIKNASEASRHFTKTVWPTLHASLGWKLVWITLPGARDEEAFLVPGVDRTYNKALRYLDLIEVSDAFKLFLQ